MIDLSEVLLQAEYTDVSLVCLRPLQIIDPEGIACPTEASLPFTGIVTPDSGDVLERTAEGSYINARITIHTPFRLTAGDATHDADLVLWQQQRYTVTTVKDYSPFGFICATAERLSLNG